MCPINDNVTSQTCTAYSHGKQRLKEIGLLCLKATIRKTGNDCADVTCCGDFQTRAAAAGKARSATVDNRVQRRRLDEAERSRRHASKRPAHGVRQQETTVLLPADT